MALINCPECRNTISSAAIACPYCGMPLVCPECGHKHPPLETRATAKERWSFKPGWLIGAAVLATSLLAFGAIWKSVQHKTAVASARVSAPAIPSTPANPTTPALSRQTILRLAGSDPAAVRLLSSLADGYLKRRGATDIHSTPRGTLEPITIEGTFAKEHSIQAIEISRSDSGRGPESLSGGGAEISLSPRRPISSAATTEEHALVADGLAVVVHPANPLQALSRDHLLTLLGGLVTDWRQLKQNPGEIRVYVPGEGAEGRETFEALFPSGKALGANAQKLSDSAQLVDAVSKDPGGIGFVAVDRTGGAKSVAIESAETGQSFPTDANILTGAYPLARRLYLYNSRSPENPRVREFVSLCLSQSGEDLARRAGFVFLGDLPAIPKDGGKNSEYAELTASALHLSFDIHFGPASTQLDTAALSQIRRAEAFLADIGQDRYSLLLLGFSDSRGNPSSHLPVSRMRAQRVAQEFNRHGMAATVIAGLGSYQPASSDDTPEGREQSRRVEVWLKQK